MQAARGTPDVPLYTGSRPGFDRECRFPLKGAHFVKGRGRPPPPGLLVQPTRWRKGHHSTGDARRDAHFSSAIERARPPRDSPSSCAPAVGEGVTSRPSETSVWRFALAESPPCQYPRRPRANGTHEAVLSKGARGGKSPWPGTVWRPVPSVPLPQGTGVHRTHRQLQATRPLPALPAHCTCWKRGHTEVTVPCDAKDTGHAGSGPPGQAMLTQSPLSIPCLRVQSCLRDSGPRAGGPSLYPWEV